jgi:hypothetical protein
MSTWTTDSSGTQSATVSTEHTLAEPTTNATYQCDVDLVNLANGDNVELRLYVKLDGTNYRLAWKATYQHAQAVLAVISPPIASLTQLKFTLKQTAGTGRNFFWGIRRI